MSLNWQLVEAIAQLVSAGAVVVSLVYLATQVRDNTRSVRAAAAREALGSMRAWNMHMVQDEGLAEMFNRGLEGMEHLTVHERSRFLYAIYNLFKTAEDLHYQQRRGTLDEDVFKSWMAVIAIHLKSPGAKQYWRARGKTFSAEFGEFYEALSTPELPRIAELVEDLGGGEGEESAPTRS